MIAMDLDASANPALLRAVMAASLRENRFDPKGLYVTPKQAELWRLVSARHSPAQSRPDFRRIYGEAFRQVTEEIRTSESLQLVGLGSGTGDKEARLCAVLQEAGHPVHFAGIDVSEDLVRASAERLVAAGARHERSLVCDLANTESIMAWLEKNLGPAPRIITFFGLVPNFTPSQLGRVVRALLRRGDLLLASVHLVPVGMEETPGEIRRGMQTVLPQYDNTETLTWLNAGLEAWDLRDALDEPLLSIGEVENVPAFIGQSSWKIPSPNHILGDAFPALNPLPLRVFQSLRYTARSFEELLLDQGLAGRCLAITDCRQEGIWQIEPN